MTTLCFADAVVSILSDGGPTVPARLTTSWLAHLYFTHRHERYLFSYSEFIFLYVIFDFMKNSYVLN